MQRELRIIFMGTPDFAVASLKKLCDNNFDVVAVITAPDRPAGRGQQLRESAVKVYAKQKRLPILQPTNLKNERFLEALSALNPNLQIVVAFRMLPKVVWQLPEYGTFNLHASLLPNYRGAAPINWAIINGETITGVTTFFIDDKIDTGEMILQKEVEIGSNETAGNLHDRLMEIGSDLVVETVNLIIIDNIRTTPQSKNKELKPAHKLNKTYCKISWDDTIYNIYNLIRGLSPYPCAWCYLKNDETEIKIKVFDVDIELEDHNLESGLLVISKSEGKVAVKNGYIKLNEIQLPGKRRMNMKDVLNGFIFKSNAKLL